MSVAGSISSALQRFGRPMTLRRTTLGPGGQQIPYDVTVYGVTDGAVIAKLIGAVVQLDTHIVISNAEITAARWPGPPKTADRIIADGKTRNVEACETKYLGTEVLVHLLQVKG